MKVSDFPQLERALSDLEGARIESAEMVWNEPLLRWDVVLRLGHRDLPLLRDGDATLTWMTKVG